jgi:hypothetical protein
MISVRNPCLVHPVALAINKKTKHLCSQLYRIIYTTTCFGLHRPSSGIAYTKCQTTCFGLHRPSSGIPYTK